MTELLDRPEVLDAPVVPDVPWLPVRYPMPLSGTEDFPTHADWLIPLVALVWRGDDGKPLSLDPWQVWLIRHILEVFPEGHPRAGELRWRQVLISVGRQNGKSVLGAILGLYGLVREAGALVIGVASSAEQARIIYTRLYAVLMKSPKLKKRFKRLTDTRGIQSLDNSRYEIKASKSSAVQGLALSVGLVDEVHITKRALWSDMVNGTRARRNGIVIGFTTAGDDTSELLLDLYDKIDKGEPGERFGYFIWEAPESRIPDDDAELGAYICQANPAVASGRVDLGNVISDVRGMPPEDAIRYILNRFVAASSGFMPLSMWTAVKGDVDRVGARPVITVDRTPGWEYATVVASWKRGETIHTEVVASIVRPTLEVLVDVCVKLHSHGPILYVADGYVLRSLVDELKRRGLPTRAASLSDATGAASLFYAKVARKHIVHPGDALMTVQLPRAVRKNVGDSFKIVRSGTAVYIDTVLATMLGVYFADITPDTTESLFI